MTLFSWLEFKQQWAEMSAEEQKTFLIWLGITILIIIGIGVFEFIIRKRKNNKESKKC